jgi:hypothetical protein
MAADNQQQDTSQYTSIYSLAIPAGIKRDGTQFQNDQYTDGVWCRFQRGDPKKMGGYRTLFQSQVGIYRGLFSQPYDGVNYIFAGNYQELDVFTTSVNYGTGSGPFMANILPGTVSLPLTTPGSGTTFTIAGNHTSLFPSGTIVIFSQTTPVNYTVSGSSYTSPNTTVTVTSTITGSPTTCWLNNTAVFTGDPDFQVDPSVGNYRVTWQFDAQFSPLGNALSVFAHPGYNLVNIDNGVTSQVLVGGVLPNNSYQWSFSGLSDSAGSNPTYKPISVDGGVCVLYPFIFVYGSHGFIANNHVSSVYPEQNFYDWNGPLANQANVSSSKIVKGMPMRGGTNSPSGLFWATDSLIRVSFNSSASATTTVNQFWNYDIISSQISIMSSNSVVEMDGIYFWMGVDRFYLYNGNVSVLPNDKNVNWLFDNLNYEQRQKVWATKIPRYNEIWFFYPRGTATECTDAIIYNVKDKLWYDAGQATGAQRSCGYTTEIFPTPIWADWNFDPVFSPPFKTIATPTGQSAPSAKQFYLRGNLTPQFSPGDSFSFSNGNVFNQTYIVASSQFIITTATGMPGATLVTATENFTAYPSVGASIYFVGSGFNIWQHEFGQNQIGLLGETAVYSSITTSDIGWLTGNPSQDGLVGINRRMHLRRVEPNFLQTGEMSMTILGRKFASSPLEEDSGPYLFSQDTGKIDLRVEHRLIRLRFVSNEIDGNYEMGRNLITCEFGDERP